SERTWVSQVEGFHEDGYNWVGDLSLDAEVQIDKAEGAVVFELGRGVDRFQLEWDLGAGGLSLKRVTEGQEGNKPEAVASQPFKAKSGTHQVRFADVDHRLTVWVDDDLVFGDGIDFAPPKQEGPTAADLEPAKVGAKGAAVAVRHLKLWRDTYYTADHQK